MDRSLPKRRKRIDVVGDRYGLLTVISEDEQRGEYETFRLQM